MKLQTPYFVINQEILEKNIREFQEALAELWPYSQLAYSIKTNSLPWLLRFMKERQIFAEAVSDEEYELAELCGFQGEEIIFNGPIKTRDGLQNAFNGKSFINLDSKEELAYIEKYHPDISGNLGLRININPNWFHSEDIGYADDGFRFGYSDETGDFEKALKVIQSLYHCNNIGLHLHCNSITRSLEVYEAIAKYAALLIEKYHLSPSYVDIGGGFFGGVEGKPTARDYINKIKNELEKVINIKETKLILEPGSALIGSAADLVTSVLDVKETVKARIVTTDGSRVHIDPLWKKTGYMHTLETTGNVIPTSQIICGYTCMDHDRLMILKDQKELSQGDRIIYHRVGAYSMTLGGAFIRYFPDIYIKNKECIQQIRERMTVREYMAIQSKRIRKDYEEIN